MAGGDSYGASLSTSESSAASQSGATDQSSSQYVLGTTYGPGSLIEELASPLGASSSAGLGVSVSTPFVIAAVVTAALVVYLFFRR